MLSRFFPSSERLNSEFILTFLLGIFQSFACFFQFLSWGAFKLSKHVYASLLLQKIFDLNGIQGRDILEAAKKDKVGAIRHFIRSDVNSVQKTNEHGTSLKEIA